MYDPSRQTGLVKSLRFDAAFVGLIGFDAACWPTEIIRSKAEPRGSLRHLDLTTTGWGWGWGPDSLWPKLLDYRDLGIIDSTPVLHTRPVCQFRDAELGRRVMAESDRILADYGCGQRMVTFAGMGPDLQELQLDPDALLVALVEGWRYLFRGDPRILNWIVASQEPLSAWPPYPVAGVPASPG